MKSESCVVYDNLSTKVIGVLTCARKLVLLLKIQHSINMPVLSSI